MKQELRAVLVHFVGGVAWSKCRTCPCLANNLYDFLQLQLWQVKLCVGFRRVYQDVTLPQILFSLRITICITQILIHFFLWTYQLSTALLPQQLLGELKGVGHKSSTSLGPFTTAPLMPLCSAEDPDLLSQKKNINWAEPMSSLSPALLYWDFSALFSCLMLWILTTLWFLE